MAKTMTVKHDVDKVLNSLKKFGADIPKIKLNVEKKSIKQTQGEAVRRVRKDTGLLPRQTRVKDHIRIKQPRLGYNGFLYVVSDRQARYGNNLQIAVAKNRNNHKSFRKKGEYVKARRMRGVQIVHDGTFIIPAGGGRKVPLVAARLPGANNGPTRGPDKKRLTWIKGESPWVSFQKKRINIGLVKYGNHRLLTNTNQAAKYFLHKRGL